MAAFQFIETPIKDLLLIETELFADSRGSFQETFRQDAFSRAVISLDFVQDNQSWSIRNVLRGLHFQRKKPRGSWCGLFSAKFMMWPLICAEIQILMDSGTASA